MNDALLIPLTAINLPLILVPTILTMKHRQKKREWIHLERMRAMQLGLPTPPTDNHAGAGSVIAIGAGVPVASVIAASIACGSVPYGSPHSLSIAAVTWGCAFLVSAGAMAASVALGIAQLRYCRTSDQSELLDQGLADKPAFDPDAYDVVGRRG
jgi:hypothetical protein